MRPIKTPPLTDAQRDLVTACIPLAHWWTGKMTRGMRPCDADDAAGAALEGLCHAASKFNPALGIAFTTYASNWIRQRVQRWHRGRKWAKGRLSVTSIDVPRDDGSKEDSWEPGHSPQVERHAGDRELVDLARSLCPPEWWRVLEVRWLGERMHGEPRSDTTLTRPTASLRSLTEAGRVLGLSRERVRQVEVLALAWLRERMPDPMLEAN
jgi:RNA polymerase sigma factor (sigma-70 family)